MKKKAWILWLIGFVILALFIAWHAWDYVKYPDDQPIFWGSLPSDIDRLEVCDAEGNVLKTITRPGLVQRYCSQHRWRNVYLMSDEGWPHTHVIHAYTGDWERNDSYYNGLFTGFYNLEFTFCQWWLINLS